MRTVTVSTCGTSILTNRTNHEDIVFLHENANKKEDEYTPEDLARINAIIKTKQIIDASPEEVKALSAE